MNCPSLHRYQLYGFVMDSPIPFPELVPAAAGGPPDVVIAVASTPAGLSNPERVGGCYQAVPGKFLIWLDGTARFLVANGCEITVDPEPAAADSEIRRLLLSAPLGAILLQRGQLPFHASAVSINGTGVLLLGGPCAGKSTAAARFRAEGFPVLSDDIASVQFDGAGLPWIMPGCPELKLWPDSLTALGQDAARLPKVGAGLEKRVLHFPEAFDPTPVPLRAVYVLESGHGAAITRVEGARRVATLWNLTYRSGFLAGPALQKQYFLQLARLEKIVRMGQTSRPENGFFGPELVRRIVEDCRR